MEATPAKFPVRKQATCELRCLCVSNIQSIRIASAVWLLLLDHFLARGTAWSDVTCLVQMCAHRDRAAPDLDHLSQHQDFFLQHVKRKTSMGTTTATTTATRHHHLSNRSGSKRVSASPVSAMPTKAWTRQSLASMFPAQHKPRCDQQHQDFEFWSLESFVRAPFFVLNSSHIIASHHRKQGRSLETLDGSHDSPSAGQEARQPDTQGILHSSTSCSFMPNLLNASSPRNLAGIAYTGLLRSTPPSPPPNYYPHEARWLHSVLKLTVSV